MPTQTAFGRMLQELVERDVIVFRPERLDEVVERRCKRLWEQAGCPNCGECALQTWEDSMRVWCRACRYAFTCTQRTPFANTCLSPGELVCIFVLYSDTLLSINQITRLFDPCYETIHSQLREAEATFERGFPDVWERIQHVLDGPTQIDETEAACSGYKGQSPPREGVSRRESSGDGRTRWQGDPGDNLTLVGACRDALRVIRAEPGASADDLRPTLTDVESLSPPLGEVWHDDWRGYDPLDLDHDRTVPHTETFVTDDGVHTNTIECLWSLLHPWLAKFRGLSRTGLRQSVRTYAFVRSLTLVPAPIHALVDCFLPSLFHQIR